MRIFNKIFKFIKQNKVFVFLSTLFLTILLAIISIFTFYIKQKRGSLNSILNENIDSKKINGLSVWLKKYKTEYNKYNKNIVKKVFEGTDDYNDWYRLLDFKSVSIFSKIKFGEYFDIETGEIKWENIDDLDVFSSSEKEKRKFKYWINNLQSLEESIDIELLYLKIQKNFKNKEKFVLEVLKKFSKEEDIHTKLGFNDENKLNKDMFGDFAGKFLSLKKIKNKKQLENILSWVDNIIKNKKTKLKEDISNLFIDTKKIMKLGLDDSDINFDFNYVKKWFDITKDDLDSEEFILDEDLEWYELNEIYNWFLNIKNKEVTFWKKFINDKYLHNHKEIIANVKTLSIEDSDVFFTWDLENQEILDKSIFFDDDGRFSNEFFKLDDDDIKKLKKIYSWIGEILRFKDGGNVKFLETIREEIKVEMNKYKVLILLLSTDILKDLDEDIKIELLGLDDLTLNWFEDKTDLEELFDEKGQFKDEFLDKFTETDELNDILEWVKELNSNEINIKQKEIEKLFFNNPKLKDIIEKIKDKLLDDYEINADDVIEILEIGIDNEFLFFDFDNESWEFDDFESLNEIDKLDKIKEWIVYQKDNSFVDLKVIVDLNIWLKKIEINLDKIKDIISFDKETSFDDTNIDFSNINPFDIHHFNADGSFNGEIKKVFPNINNDENKLEKINEFLTNILENEKQDIFKKYFGEKLSEITKSLSDDQWQIVKKWKNFISVDDEYYQNDNMGFDDENKLKLSFFDYEEQKIKMNLPDNLFESKDQIDRINVFIGNWIYDIKEHDKKVRYKVDLNKLLKLLQTKQDAFNIYQSDEIYIDNIYVKILDETFQENNVKVEIKYCSVFLYRYLLGEIKLKFNLEDGSYYYVFEEIVWEKDSGYPEKLEKIKKILS